MEPSAILGLSINTRKQGLAVISNNLLVDYHIQLRKEAWTTNKGEQILTSLQPWFKSYSIKNVALSIPYEKQQSTQTKDLLGTLKSYFKQKKILYSTYLSKTLYATSQKARRKTKKEMMRDIVFQYPELSFYYHKEVENKNKYFIKLFEAVAVATMHAQRLKSRK